MSTDIHPLVDRIREIRSYNNDLWMEILEIALTHAPEPTKQWLRGINDNDREISELLGRLAND